MVGGLESKLAYTSIFNAAGAKFNMPPPPIAAHGPARRKGSVAGIDEHTDPMPMGIVTVTVVEGVQLVAKDRIKGAYSSSDPYVVVGVLDTAGMLVPSSRQTVRKRAESVCSRAIVCSGLLTRSLLRTQTRTVDKSLMPVWDQTFRVTIPPQTVGLVFTVWDKDTGAKAQDDFMGQTIIFAKEFTKLLGASGKWEGWRKLEQRAGQQERVSGKLHLILEMDASLLVEADTERHFGIDMFRPERRESVTRLDFDISSKFSTFSGARLAVRVVCASALTWACHCVRAGQFKGKPVRVWVSDQCLALHGET